MSLKRFCDRCQKDTGKTYYHIEVDSYNNFGSTMSYKSVDLCENCYRQFENFLKEINHG